MLEGKVAIVTGAAQGIGRHAATTFAQEKAKVVVADVNEEKAQKTASELAELTETVALPVDVRNEESVKRMIDQVVNHFGQIDVHINNAAIVPHFAWGIPRWPSISNMPKDFGTVLFRPTSTALFMAPSM
jgi:NAD(P)-dependent dehydrogenase (short-subunit alcohol dehydrogenase family)